MAHVLNDVHSQLNATTVDEIVRPQSLIELQDSVRRAQREGRKISVAGARHAMGGQQFLSASLHIDMRALDRVINVDAVRGLLHIEAGADWPKIVTASRAMGNASAIQWGIRQKQTGVDEVSLGGSISANAHGRGLTMQPLSDDVEDITLVTAAGDVVFCNRQQHADLFALAVGGYGMFGIVYSATLRLMPRQYLTRMVDILDLDDALNAMHRRIAAGCLYGDFQFVIDAHDERFLRRGVLSCYAPCDVDATLSSTAADLTADAWLQLLRLAHENKREAFQLYSQHYLSTDGNGYWSDTMQLSTYIPSYVEFIEQTRTAKTKSNAKETLVIGEHYVPCDRLLIFMQQARQTLRSLGAEVIYGTIRVIRRDTLSFLPWARNDFACVIFNLRTSHTDAGRQRTADSFRALIDICIALGGSFFLTYHRYATRAQVEACYPQFQQWLALKKRHDPNELFNSSWYAHYRDVFARQ